MSYSSPSTRWAQTLMFLAAASPLAARATDQVTLQPVEVTTSKVPVALRDTPAAVTVISGAELRARGAHDLRTALAQVAARVRQLCTQVSDFLVCRFQKCHYSRVICSGRRGLESLRVANKALCSSLVVDRPAEGCEPFKVMR